MSICFRAIGFLLFGLWGALSAFGQIPPLPEGSDCYGLAIRPPAYDTVAVNMMVRPAGPAISLTEPVYDTLPERYLVADSMEGPVLTQPEMVPVQERILIEEAHTRLELVPAVYDTVKQVVMIEPTRIRKMVVPAQYDTLIERVVVSEGGWSWMAGELDPDCISADPEDCRERCLVRIPPVYQEVEKLVMIAPPRVVTGQVKAIYDTVFLLTMREAPSYREVEVPATYDTITHHLLKTPGSAKTGMYPARYRTVKRRELKKEEEIIRDSLSATYLEVTHLEPQKRSPLLWVQIPCEEELDDRTYEKVFLALKQRGYISGDEVPVAFTTGLERALRSFQHDQGLPEGQLDYQTLERLGLK